MKCKIQLTGFLLDTIWYGKCLQGSLLLDNTKLK